MKPILLSFLVSILFVSCTTYNSEIKNNSYSPVASTQVLRNAPLLKTTKNILFFTKDNIDCIDEIFKDKSKINGEFFYLKNTETEKLYVETDTIDSFLKTKNKLFTEPVYLNFQYMQDLVNISGDHKDFDISNNTTTITKGAANLKYNTERKIFFKNEITTRLLLNDIQLTDDVDKAKYIMNITIYEDGLMDKSKITFFYLFSKTSGIIGLNVEFIDIKEKKVILSYFIKNRSIYKDARFLYFIPKIQMTEDLEYEY